MAEQVFPEPTVGILIFDPEGKMLLVRSHKWKNKYVIPGGHVELGESLIDAVKREAKEETNLDVLDIEFVCMQEYIYGEGFYKDRHFLFLDFSCKTNSTEVILNDEAEEYKWLTYSASFDLPVEKYTREVIDTFFNKW